MAGKGGLSSDARPFRGDPVVLAPSPSDMPGDAFVGPDLSGERVDLVIGYPNSVPQG